MRRSVNKTLLLLSFSMICFLNLLGQTNPIYFDNAQVFPQNPSPTDSVFLVYSYESSDACPDFHLIKDSVVENSVYVLKLNILAQGRICAQVVTKFKTKVFLGFFNEKTNVYLDGNLISTINPHACNMDKIGKVISVTEKSSIIQDENSEDVYEISDEVLKIGTLVKFHGTKIQCFTTPCYNIVNCFTIIDITDDCIMDKKGIVIAGKGACEGQLFVQEFTPKNNFPFLYLVNNADTTYTNSDNENGVVPIYLKDGDVVNFDGYLLEGIQDTASKCAYNGIVRCYELIDTNQCIMDKMGVVVAGEGECANQLLVQEETGDNTLKVLYGIVNNNNDEIPVNSNQYGGLKLGDKLKFGSRPLKLNEGNVISLCKISGVVACFELISPYQECIIDKKGVVVQGKNLCEGQLFIKELTANYSTPKLYIIIPDGVINNDGTNISSLKEGDKVAFGSMPFTVDTVFVGMNDSTYLPPVVDCAIAGFATCYELTEAAETFSLRGKAKAGNNIVQSGSAILFANGFNKALNAVNISNDGTFIFKDLIPGEYTVRIIPDFTLYKNYLPTFYINKLRFKRADYISLKSSIDTITIQLRTRTPQLGNGKIYGNIFYESTGLKDTVMAENGVRKYKAISEQNYANNLPVILLNSKNQAVEWTLTDEFGNYKFENIALDSYIIISETAGAEAEISVNLTVNNAVVNADLVLKSSDANTDVITPNVNINYLYPNPVIDYLTISLLKNEIVRIYNATGQLSYQQQVFSGTNVLDLSNLNKGLYFIQLGNEKAKFIKK